MNPLRRILLAAALVVAFAAPARALPPADIVLIAGSWPTPVPSGLALPSATITGNTSLAYSAPYTIAGATIQSLFLGYGAGAAYPVSADSGYGSVAVGAAALSALTATNAEDTALGDWAFQYCTTCSLGTAVGMHAGGSEVSAPGDTLTGNDAMRDAISQSNAGYVTADGAGACKHGYPGGGTACLGASAGFGNSAAELISGTLTTSGVITITVAASGSTPGSVTGLPVTASHTIAGGDTNATVAAALAAQFNNVIAGPSYGLGASSQSNADGSAGVAFQFPGSTTNGWTLSVSHTVTGSSGTTVTDLAGFNPTNAILAGNNAFEGGLAASSNNLSVFGANTAGKVYSGNDINIAGSSSFGAAGTLRYVSSAGSDVAPSLTFGTSLALAGYGILGSATSTTNDAIVGTGSFANVTTGTYLSGLGDHLGSTCTTATDVLLLGTNGINCSSAGEAHAIHIGASNGDIIHVTGTNTPSTSATTLAGTLTMANIPADTGKTDAAVCEDTTNHQLWSGTGTGGACLGTSSERFKTAITDVGAGLWDVLRVRAVNFVFKPGYGDDGRRWQYGFLAEEVARVIPGLVHDDAAGKPESVDYVGFVPVLVRAVQSLQYQFAALWVLVLAMAGVVGWLFRRVRRLEQRLVAAQ